MRRYRSLDEARAAFDVYVELEPELERLWELCRAASPPARDADSEDDDPFAADIFAADRPDDGWCAEDDFLEHVKPQLERLVGAYRPGDRDRLHERETYEVVYDVLMNWALHRPCACCAVPLDHRGPATAYAAL